MSVLNSVGGVSDTSEAEQVDQLMKKWQQN
jgi:hypothetical protein